MNRWLLVGALGLALLTGCSDDNDGDAADDVAPTTTTTATATEPTTTTTTTTVAPEDIQPLDDEGVGFDIDREVAPGSEGESLGPIGTTETTIPTDEGEISIGGGDVPDLADTFPLPEGFEVQLTTEVPGEVGFSGRIDGELDELVLFFETELDAAGYDITDRQSVPGVLAALTVAGPLEGDVVISEEPGVDGGWTILIALAEPA